MKISDISSQCAKKRDNKLLGLTLNNELVAIKCVICDEVFDMFAYKAWQAEEKDKNGIEKSLQEYTKEIGWQCKMPQLKWVFLCPKHKK